jgi:hypothetical protein
MGLNGSEQSKNLKKEDLGSGSPFRVQDQRMIEGIWRLLWVYSGVKKESQARRLAKCRV